MKFSTKIRDAYYKLGVMATMPALMATGSAAEESDIDRLNSKATR